MSYDIPRNLSKYAEEFLFGLTLKQFIYAGIALVSSFLIYTFLQDLMDRWIIFLIILPVLGLGAMFTFFELDSKIMAQLSLKKSLYKASYFDRSVNSFIDVSEIKQDSVVLKNGTILGIIEVKPIDFFILSKEEKKKRLESYAAWLRSIDYYVQILSRSVSVDLQKWLKNVKKKSASKSRAETFSEWMSSETGKSSIRNRVFYLIIPEKPDFESRSKLEDFKSIFTGDYGAEQFDFEKQKKSLKNNINNCIETLSKCGLKMRRLKTDELLGLYSSYFINQSKVNKTILSPIMALDKKITQEQDELFNKLKNETIKQIEFKGN